MMALRLPSALVSRSLGVVLLAAAILKLNGLAADPVGRMGLFTAPAFQVAVVELEFFLAVWLLWGARPLGSWMTAVVVFAVFSGVSAWQGRVGRASCGCFGRLSVSPWYALGIDLVVLLALCFGRPDFGAVRWQPWIILMSVLPAVSGVGGTVLVLAGLVGLASSFDGSADAAVARLRGERISLYPRLLDIGTGAPGETREAEVEVVNRTDYPIRLIGGAKD